MFAINFFKDAYEWLYPTRFRVLLIGLDNSGKSTMLNFLLTHRFAQIHPTLVPNSDEVKIDNVTYLITDLGGDKISRKKWREYFDIIDGIIFMIDASDAQRIQDAKHEIDLLREVEKLQHIPIAILGNKEDKSNCLNENELREQLGLTRDKTYGNDHNGTNPNKLKIEVFMCSVLRKYGFVEGFQWLSKFLNQN